MEPGRTSEVVKADRTGTRAPRIRPFSIGRENAMLRVTVPKGARRCNSGNSTPPTSPA